VQFAVKYSQNHLQNSGKKVESQIIGKKRLQIPNSCDIILVASEKGDSEWVKPPFWKSILLRIIVLYCDLWLFPV
jgi:hypothetical protein